MSSLYGVASPPGATSAPELMLRMGAALSVHPSDATGHYVAAGIALGAHALWTVPEARNKDIPFRDRDAGLVCVADARLDEREQLADTLAVSRSLSDEALICAAYGRFGLSFAAHLLGDFALALYDAKHERLVLARDAYGLRSLYWTRAHDGTVLFASQAKPLFCHVPMQIDALRVAQYLARDFGDNERTFFEGIERLPPGHTLVVENGQPRLIRYFAFDPDAEHAPRASSAFAEEFRDILTASVRARLRSHRSVGCMLSGGLDSSGVLGAMRTLEPARDVPCFSARFPMFPAIDEGPWLDLLTQKGGVSRHDVRADELGPLDDIERVYDALDEPFHAPNLFIYRRLAQHAQDHGVSVLLDGLDGDTVVEHGVYFLAELLGRGRMRTLGRELSALKRRTGLSFRTLIASWVLGPHADRARAVTAQLGFPSRGFLSHSFAERSGFLEHARARAERELETPLTFRALHFRAVTAPIVPFYLEVHDKLARSLGVDHRHPFFDRRLIAFCLALPPEQRLKDGWDRVIQRRALEGLVPDEIRARQAKSVWTINFQTQLFARHGALIASITDAPDSPLIGICDMSRLKSARKKLAVGARADDVNDLWTAVTLGLWLRGLPAAL